MKIVFGCSSIGVNKPISLHQAWFIKACSFGIWVSDMLVWAETWTLSSDEIQSRVAGPEEDINLAEGQFMHLEELWSSNWITAASTVLKNENESQASSWLSKLWSYLHDKCALGLTLTDPHRGSKLYRIKHNCAV